MYLTVRELVLPNSGSSLRFLRYATSRTLGLKPLEFTPKGRVRQGRAMGDAGQLRKIPFASSAGL